MSVSATATIDEVQISTPELTLDDLSEKNTEELESIYRSGEVPKNFSSMDGKPAGRMLAIRATGSGLIFKIFKRIAASESFIWGGISFKANNKKEGTGINRIKLAALGKHNLFPFDTKIEKSLIDEKECVQLDFDKPQNPWAIRKIHDELREVSPGLLLGPAMLKTSKEGASFVLWFALDLNDQKDEF